MTTPFITLEGIDGSGKTTQARMLVDLLKGMGREVLAVREPGGTPISEKIRSLLLDPANAEMSDTCELLLLEAARAQHVDQAIRPALAAGKVVVCDRFLDSSTAYQSFADGLDLDTVTRANALAVGDCVPGITLIFDIDVDAAAARMARRGGKADRMEAKGLEFQRKVADGYRMIAAADPGRVKLIDAAGTPDEVHARVVEALAAAGLV